MPFALNAATRFISPTKTPEYLAAGCPVVSTPVRDVVRSYGGIAGVRIAEGADAFVAACDAALAAGRTGWRAEADAHLAGQSWDATHAAMAALVDAAVARKAAGFAPPPAAPAVRRPARPPYDVVVAGAGFAGSVIAERMAEASGKRVLVCDTRDHVAGNAYDAPDAAGILVHRYGPHIFHTNARGGRRLPVALHRVAALRASRARRPRRPAPADADQPHDARRGLRPRRSPTTPPPSGCSPSSPSRSRRSRTARDAVVATVGTPALRDLLRGLHPQAVGPRPLRARPQRHGAGAGPRHRRRPLLPRPLPGDAARRLHPDVRADARPSAHRPRARHRLPRPRRSRRR